MLLLGDGFCPFPCIDPARLIEEFGDVRGAKLEAEVTDLLNELTKIEVDWAVHSLQSASDLVYKKMATRHADLTNEAIQALVWKFSFDWR